LEPLGVHDAPPPPKTPPRATGFVAVLLRQLVGSSWGRYPLVIYWTFGSQNRGPRSEEYNLPRPIALEKLVKSEKRLAPLPPHSPQPNPMPKSTSLGALLSLLGSFWGRFGSVLGSFWACFSIVGPTPCQHRYPWTHFCSFWDHFGIVLGPFWGPFGHPRAIATENTSQIRCQLFLPSSGGGDSGVIW